MSSTTDTKLSAQPEAAKPWDRLPKESAKAYAAFMMYLKFGSLDAVAEERLKNGLKRNRSQLGKWSTRHRWVKRAKARGDRLAQIEQETAERFARQEGEKWERRRRDRLEEKYQLGCQFVETSKMINKLPIMKQERVVEKYDDGREKVIQKFKPVGVRKRDAIPHGRAGFDLMDEAIREATATTEVVETDVYNLVPLEPTGKK